AQAISFLSGLAAGVISPWARRQLGGLVPVFSVQTGEGGPESARVRIGTQLDQLIPPFLRGIVRGVYVEGNVLANPGQQQGGTESTTNAAAGTTASPYGVLLELQFPYSIVTRAEFKFPNAWSLDAIWEP